MIFVFSFVLKDFIDFIFVILPGRSDQIFGHRPRNVFKTRVLLANTCGFLLVLVLWLWMFSLSVNRRCNGGGSEALLCKYINLANCISYKSASLGILRSRYIGVHGALYLPLHMCLIDLFWLTSSLRSLVLSADPHSVIPYVRCDWTRL